MKTLMSNEYLTASLSIPSVMREANEAKGYGLDPADLLIELEERAQIQWRSECPQAPQKSFVHRYIQAAIANL